MELNKKANRKKTDTSLPLSNLEWCRRTITEVNEQYQEFLTKTDGHIVNINRVNDTNNIDNQQLQQNCQHNRFTGLECNCYDTCSTPSTSNQSQCESRKFKQHKKLKNLKKKTSKIAIK